jgi:predicted RNA-binding protein with EMAP domain
MKRINHRKLAINLAIRGIRGYKQKFMQEEDLLNGEDRRKILEEMDSIIEELKNEKTYKKEAERLKSRLNYLYSLDDCDEEFEL